MMHSPLRVCLILLVGGCTATGRVAAPSSPPTDTAPDTDTDTNTDTDTGPGEVSENRLANPGFEQGETWWTQADGTLNHAWVATGDAIHQSSATFSAREGSHAYKIWGRYADSVPNDSEHGLDLIDLTPGDTLTLTAHALTHPDDRVSQANVAVLFLRFLDAGGDEQSVVLSEARVDASTAAGEWHALTVEAVVPAGVSRGQLGVRYTLSDWSAGGSVYLDDMAWTSTGTGRVDGERLLVWQDEFDGDAVDPARWTHEILGAGTYNNELQAYTADPDNARVEDGRLIITAIPEAGSATAYSSARLITDGKAAWRYGRIEGALQVPSGVGTWPALWMLPSDWAYGGWPSSGEIDIMEHVGCDANQVVGTVHTGAYNHTIGTQRGQTLPLSTATTAMHVYAIDWTPDYIHFFVDEHLYFSFDNDGTGDPATWPFDQRFHLLVNLAVGGDWGGYCGVDRAAFPQAYALDWIRVYQSAEEAAGTE